MPCGFLRSIENFMTQPETTEQLVVSVQILRDILEAGSSDSPTEFRSLRGKPLTQKDLVTAIRTAFQYEKIKLSHGRDNRIIVVGVTRVKDRDIPTVLMDSEFVNHSTPEGLKAAIENGIINPRKIIRSLYSLVVKELVVE